MNKKISHIAYFRTDGGSPKLYTQEYVDTLQRQTLIMEHYLELIYDIGYDYDGLNDKESLKSLIDELIHYASLGRACNTTEPIYCNGDKKFNILHEEIK